MRIGSVRICQNNHYLRIRTYIPVCLIVFLFSYCCAHCKSSVLLNFLEVAVVMPDTIYLLFCCSVVLLHFSNLLLHCWLVPSHSLLCQWIFHSLWLNLFCSDSFLLSIYIFFINCESPLSICGCALFPTLLVFLTRANVYRIILTFSSWLQFDRIEGKYPKRDTIIVFVLNTTTLILA